MDPVLRFADTLNHCLYDGKMQFSSSPRVKPDFTSSAFSSQTRRRSLTASGGESVASASRPNRMMIRRISLMKICEGGMVDVRRMSNMA